MPRKLQKACAQSTTYSTPRGPVNSCHALAVFEHMLRTYHDTPKTLGEHSFREENKPFIAVALNGDMPKVVNGHIEVIAQENHWSIEEEIDVLEHVLRHFQQLLKDFKK